MNTEARTDVGGTVTRKNKADVRTATKRRVGAERFTRSDHKPAYRFGYAVKM